MLEAVTGCPQSLVRCFARMRAFRSVTPPGGNGTIRLTSLLGKLCAAAGSQASIAPKPISSADCNSLVATCRVRDVMASSVRRYAGSLHHHGPFVDLAFDELGELG